MGERRLRVAVDFKVMSTEAALRGMGRYTQQQIRAALEVDGNLEILLLLHDQLEERNCLIDWLSHPRVTPARLHCDDVKWKLNCQPTFREALSYTRRLDATLRHLGADIYHSTTPFMVPFGTGVTACRVVSTFYDCIPLLFPSYYLPQNPECINYFLSLNSVRRSERVIAISHASKEDLCKYTGYDPDQVDVAYPIVESVFRRNQPGENDKTGLAASLNWLPPPRFILSVTGFHRSKNVKSLLKAYALARGDGLTLPLVLVLPSMVAPRFFHTEHGHPENVYVLADIPDADLARLYRLADFVVQLSLYEGFGYPVAEAMASGAAVIGANTASIPEMAGDAALLVHPLDIAVAARHMRRLAEDASLRDHLRGRSLQRTSLFSTSEALGVATASAYRAALRTPSSCKPVIAFWSSMPPLDCGVADYTAELVDELSASNQIHVYTDGTYTPTIRSSDQVLFRDPASYDLENHPDDTVFQLGGRDYQVFMFDPLRRHGGTVVLHDISMGVGLYYRERAKNRLEHFEDHFMAPEGPEAYAEYQRAAAMCDSTELTQLLELLEQRHLLRWAIGTGNRVLVHTEELRDEVIRAYPDADVQVVRMGVADPLPSLRYTPRQAWRTALGVGSRGLIVGSFGIVDRVKRLSVVIRSFANLLSSRPDSVLFIVGRAYDSVYATELRAEIEALQLEVALSY
jgi:glycosyltransferase involved in cell wall biosynthesis